MKEGWEYKKLIDVCDFQGGSQPPKSEWINHDSPGYIRMLQIRDFTQSRKVSPEYVKLTNRTKCCFSDDILIGRYGASLGKILTGIAGAYNVAIMRTIPNETLLSKGYLKYYLMSSIFQSFLLNIGGRAAQAGFNKEDLKCLNIPLTTLDEQRRIVSYLDSSFKLIDEIKDKALKSLTEAKALFQSALAEAMEPKEGWEEKTLQDVAVFRNGIAHEKSIDNEKGCFIVVNSKFVSSEGKIMKCCNSQLSPLYEGDIVMVMSDVPNGKALAKCFIIDNNKKYTLNQRICAFSNHKIDTKYLYFHINRNKYFLEFDNGENQTNLRKNDILKCPVYFPSIDTQKQIVSHLDKLSSKVRAIEEKYQKMVEECDALKQAMLRDVFE